jgi:hypothetical protein
MTSAWVLISVLGAGATAAQEELRLELFRPRLEITSEGLPQSDFEDFNGDLLQRRTDLRFNLPLGPVHLRPEKKLLGYQLFAQASLSSSPIELTLPGTEVKRRLYTGAMRVSGLMASRAGSFYLASLGASVAEDEDTIDNATVRFSGVGLGTYATSDTVTLLYGGAVVFGDQLAVPLFGVLWKFRPDWTLFTVLPVSLRTTYKWTERTRIHFLLEGAGARHRFANQGLFPFQPDTVYYRAVGLKLGTEWEFRPGGDQVFLVQAGVLAARELKFSTEQANDAFLSTGIAGAGYLKLGWRISFGESLLDKMEQGGI